MSKNTGLILAGLAAAGVGAYFLFNKKPVGAGSGSSGGGGSGISLAKLQDYITRIQNAATATALDAVWNTITGDQLLSTPQLTQLHSYYITRQTALNLVSNVNPPPAKFKVGDAVMDNAIPPSYGSVDTLRWSAAVGQWQYFVKFSNQLYDVWMNEGDLKLGSGTSGGTGSGGVGINALGQKFFLGDRVQTPDGSLGTVKAVYPPGAKETLYAEWGYQVYTNSYAVFPQSSLILSAALVDHPPQFKIGDRVSRVNGNFAGVAIATIIASRAGNTAIGESRWAYQVDKGLPGVGLGSWIGEEYLRAA